MKESTKTAPRVKGQIDEEIVERAVAAAEGAPSDQRIRAGLKAAIGIAETDLAAASSALADLRSDYEARGRLEEWLGGDASRATFGLGAALQVATAEFASPLPDLRSRAPELLRWLEGDW